MFLEIDGGQEHYTGTMKQEGTPGFKQHPTKTGTFWHPKDLEVVPHPEIIVHINNDMNITIHIDINMNIDIHIIINMNIEDYKRYYLLFIRYSLLGIPYWNT